MVDAEAALAARIARERGARGWSLAALAERSGVSRSMLSKIERREASPTAAVLLKIASALDLTLAELLTEPEATDPRFLAAAGQPVWVDPATAYLRRQVYLSPAMPLELVEIEFPAGARVAIPAASYVFIKQVVWVLDGTVTIYENGAPTILQAGDRLLFGPPSDVIYENSSDRPCRYLVAVVRG